MKLVEETPYRFRIEREGDMRVPGVVFISRALLPEPRHDKSLQQVANVATLPGIGPELGRRIVAFREKHGPFRRVEDLLVIRGIGQKKWKAIRPLVRVGGDAEKTKSLNDQRGKEGAVDRTNSAARETTFTRFRGIKCSGGFAWESSARIVKLTLPH